MVLQGTFTIPEMVLCHFKMGMDKCHGPLVLGFIFLWNSCFGHSGDSLRTVIGNGREPTLPWKFTRSHHVKQFKDASGNVGTATLKRFQNVPCSVCQDENVELVIVGPEAHLTAGVVETQASAGVQCFSPIPQTAQLKSSLMFAKKFMD